jgi:hypothetical protein
MLFLLFTCLFNDFVNSSNYKVICDNELKVFGRMRSWRNLIYCSDNIRMEKVRKTTETSGRTVDFPALVRTGNFSATSEALVLL